MLLSGLVFKNIKLMFLVVIPRIKTFDVLVETFFLLAEIIHLDVFSTTHSHNTSIIFLFCVSPGPRAS